MADSTLNRFVATGTTAERTAFTPTPPTPASGPDPGYLWWDTDLQAEYAYDFGTAAWVSTTGGAGTVTNSGTLTADAVILGNGTTVVKALAMGTAGQVLTVNGGATAAAWATPAAGSSVVVQVKNTQTGAVATGSTGIPYDDTIPQNTEGDEYMTLAITPTSATNKLKIEVVWVGTTVGQAWIIVALFQDSTANALAAACDFHTVSTSGTTTTFTHYMTSGTTSATTFKVRAGIDSGGAGGTMTFNGQSGGRIFGGVSASSITITEIVP